MVNSLRRCLAAVIVSTTLFSALAASARPLIVVFPASGFASSPRGRKGAPAVDPSLLGMRAVRDRLVDGSVVEAVSYDAENALFIRAILENKLKVNTANPTPEDRLAIGKALGALYVMTVISGSDPKGGVFVEAQATPVKSGSVWTDREVGVAASSLERPILSVHNPFADDLLSAANTLARRFLTGPLAAFSKGAIPAPPPSLSNPAPEMVMTARDMDKESSTLVQSSEAMLRAGDMNGAIVTLRKSVNLAPRSSSARMALTRAYLQARRPLDAAAEARRALAILTATDAAGQADLTRLLGQALAQSGDTTAAHSAFEQIITAQPRNAPARLALADLLIGQGKLEDAESQ